MIDGTWNIIEFMHEFPMNLLFKNFISQILGASSLTYIYIYMSVYGCYWHQRRKEEKIKVSHSKCGEKMNE